MTPRTGWMAAAFWMALAACGQGSADRAASRDSIAPAAESIAARRATDSAAWGRVYTGEIRETARLRGVEGTLTIEEPDSAWTHRSWVKVDGRTVLVDSVSYGLSVHAWWAYPPAALSHRVEPEGTAPLGSTALIAVGLGGTGCPVEYRIVEIVHRDSAVVTEAFGTCSEVPDSVWWDAGGALRIRFEDYAPLRVTLEPDFTPQPPATWIYRGGGRLEVLKER